MPIIVNLDVMFGPAVKATSRSVAVLIVLAAHVGLVHLLMRGDRRIAVQPETHALTMVWIRAASPVRSAPAEGTAAPQRPVRAAQPTTRLAVEPVGNAIHVPALIVAPSADRPADHNRSATAAALPDPPASAPLDLRLPTRAPAQRGLAEAARDAHQPRPLDHGQRLARDLGTDTRLVETVTDQGRRYVSGRSCIELRSSQASRLDPFNASTQPSPKLAGRC